MRTPDVVPLVRAGRARPALATRACLGTSTCGAASAPILTLLTGTWRPWRARRQGKASFGDAGVFVEKYVQRARHIEVQIFGDGAGGIVTLPERECSVQRRHQKVVEETPSPYVRERPPSAWELSVNTLTRIL